MSSLKSYSVNDYRNYLAHYGIIGQKWGIRRFQNPDGSYTAAGKIRYSDRNELRVDENVAPELIIAASLLAPYALLAIPYAADKVDRAWASHKVNKAVEKIKKERIGAIDEETGLRKRTDENPIEEDLKNVNPAYNRKVPRTYNNCVLCSMATETRRRGFDVMAQFTEQGFPGLHETKKAFPKGKGKIVDPDNLFSDKDDDMAIHWPAENKDKVIKNIIGARSGLNSDYAQATLKSLAKEKNARGSIFVQWGYGGGHAMSYDVKNGKVRLIDGQTNKIYEGEAAEWLLAHTWHASTYRLDKLKMNSSAIKDYVM